MGKKHLGDALTKARGQDLCNEDWAEYPDPRLPRMPWESLSSREYSSSSRWWFWQSLSAAERQLWEEIRPEEKMTDADWHFNNFYSRAIDIFRSYPRLEILAYGDFTNNNRYRCRNIIFARDPSSDAQVKFRVIDTEEIDGWTGVENPMEFLSACPGENLLGKFSR